MNEIARSDTANPGDSLIERGENMKTYKLLPVSTPWQLHRSQRCRNNFRLTPAPSIAFHIHT
jgi:selenophosphate synthetase-related protein